MNYKNPNIDPASAVLLQSIAAYLDRNFKGLPDFLSAAPVMGDVSLARQQVCRSRKAPASMAPQTVQKMCSLEEMLNQEDAGFSETLLKLIDQTGEKDSVIYKRANLSKQHFSKIRNNPNYNPTKATAVALALALELDLDQTRDLIGRAGYALSNSSKFDLIIRYFIENKNYDIVQINMALYEFDQILLGN